MAGRPLRLLILEDRPEDAELALRELRRAGFDPSWRRVDADAGFQANLDPELDLILADYHQPQFDALRGLKLMQEAGLEIPFVIVSGAVGDDLAVAAVRQGAMDYVLKDRLGRLGTAGQKAHQQGGAFRPATLPPGGARAPPPPPNPGQPSQPLLPPREVRSDEPS